MNNRSFKLINPKIQNWFLSLIAGGALLCTVVGVTASNIFFETIKSKVVAHGISAESILVNFLSQQQYLLTITLVIAGLVTVIILTIVGYFLSHKIVGPIYRIKQCLEKYNSGDKEMVVSIRKDDFFQELPELINTALKTRQ